MIKVKSQLGDMGMEIPSHTLEALELYLIHGYHPGGFLSSVLAGDFFRAVSTADTAIDKCCGLLVGGFPTRHHTVAGEVTMQ